MDPGLAKFLDPNFTRVWEGEDSVAHACKSVTEENLLAAIAELAVIPHANIDTFAIPPDVCLLVSLREVAQRRGIILAPQVQLAA